MTSGNLLPEVFDINRLIEVVMSRIDMRQKIVGISRDIRVERWRRSSAFARVVVAVRAGGYLGHFPLGYAETIGLKCLGTAGGVKHLCSDGQKDCHQDYSSPYPDVTGFNG